MKKFLHRNVLSCAASPMKLLELKSSKQICYQVAASPLHRCALLLAEMITITKQRLKLDISHHESMHPPSSLLMHLTSSQGDKSSVKILCNCKEYSYPLLWIKIKYIY
jgi:hypothetical protein